MKDKIEKTLSGLKDFQLKTVDYVMHQFDIGHRRMLIADEVGLGKTIVAKGIIARMFQESVLQHQKKQFKVVYVCSNQAIAKANINKLNFSEDASAVMVSSDDDRITSLAYSDTSDDPSQQLFIRAFTPVTSFDDKTHAGKKDERVLLYRLLYDYAEINPDKKSLKWILKGNNSISDKSWKNEIKNAENGYGRPIKGKVRSDFRCHMDKEVRPEDLPKSFTAANLTYPVKYWTLLKRLCQLEIRKNNYYNFDFMRELIINLRLTLSISCLDYLEADLFILDEFQRYKKIIKGEPENDSPAINLARAIFSKKDVNILMLSATPFKAYTTDFEEFNGENHFKEFETVLRFLNNNSDADWNEFNNNRNQLFSFLRHPKQNIHKKENILKVKDDLEAFYRECMVRTERVSVSNDRDSLIKSMLADCDRIEPEINDIEEFVAIDRLTAYLNYNHSAKLPVPIEYVKSSPYALSFMDGYQHRIKLKKSVAEDDNLKQMLKELKNAWVDIDAVSEYKKLSEHLPNGKLRLLLEETIEKGAWKLLWIPPSMPYYEFGEPFLSLSDFSKILVFSSWVLVPKMISTIVSYEAERHSVGDPASISNKKEEKVKREYFIKKRHPRPQIVYSLKKGDGERSLNQPSNIIYLYPGISLAQIYDPEQNLIDKKPISQIKNDLESTVKKLLLSKEIQSYATGNGDMRTWYWASPLLLDKISQYSEIIREWFEKGSSDTDSVTDSEDETLQHDERKGKDKYFNRLKEVYNKPESLELPLLTDEQAEKVAKYVVTLVLASPSVCYLRTQLRYNPEPDIEMLDGAFKVASAFVTTFNKPESIALIRLCTKEAEESSYLDSVLHYSMAGNIQAMLDEYYHLIREIEGLYSVKEISEYISDVLTIRSSTTKVDDLSSFLKNTNGDGEIKSKAIRTHFALDFAGKKLSTAKTSGREVNIRQAFNSPFRPFVLATTSIGQEGLDFHLYCRKIFHWNLPSNAIDIEQREGRINRYKGLVIRQNLVKKYSSYISEKDSRNSWERIFNIAENMEGKGQGLCEIIPFWHTEPDEKIRIERFVPLYSFSRDIDKYNELLKVLVYYRITFGQPRQEELIKAISELGEEENFNDFKDLLIDLSPMRFYNA